MSGLGLPLLVINKCLYRMVASSFSYAPHPHPHLIHHGIFKVQSHFSFLKFWLGDGGRRGRVDLLGGPHCESGSLAFFLCLPSSGVLTLLVYSPKFPYDLDVRSRCHSNSRVFMDMLFVFGTPTARCFL